MKTSCKSQEKCQVKLTVTLDADEMSAIVKDVEKVFVSGNFRDADDAKRLVAYVFKAMHCDIGRNADPRVEDLSMRLPKGMGVFEIMSECGIGVYEARQVQSLII